MQSKISKTVTFLSVFIWAVLAFSINALWLCSLVLFCVLVYLKYKDYISSRFLVVLLCVFCFGFIYSDFKTPKGDALQEFVNQKIILQGVVDTDVKYKDNKAKFYLKASSLIADKTTLEGGLGRVAVSVYRAKNIEIGDVIQVKGKLYKPFEAKNIGQFDYADYLKNKGVFTSFYTNSYKKISEDKGLYYQLIKKFNKFRKKIMLAHQRHLGDNASLLGGIIFGYRAVDIPDNTRQDFINSGLLHLLSASGLHVGLILGLWYFLMRALRVSVPLGIISGGVIVFLYSCLTGFPPSILRAMLMAEFILLGKLIDRKADNIALLLLVCSILLLFDPMYIKNAGFQLSFIVTFGILFCLPIFIEKVNKIPEFLAGSILVPAIAQLWAMPLLIYHFNSLPLYSVIANIIVIPFMAIISFVGFLSSISALIPYMDWVCMILDKILQPFLSVLSFVSQYVSELSGSLIYVAKPLMVCVFLFYVAVVIFSLLIKNDFYNNKLKISFCGILVLMLALSFNYDFSKRLKFTFFSVGNGDAIYVELPNKKNFLVDAGRLGFGKYNSGFSIINEYFKDKGITPLDAMVLTHPDSDHIGGAVDVLEFLRPEEVFLIDERSKSNVYKNLENYLYDNKSDIIYAKTNDKLALDKDVWVKFIVPNGKNAGTFNDDSIINYIKYKDFSALFLGDNEYQCLDLLKKHINPPVDILKVGHHGSAKSVNSNMLDFLQPKVAVISVGRNSFGHPDEKILNLLKAKGIKVLRTDKFNMIDLGTDGFAFDVHHFNTKSKSMKKVL